MAVLFLFYFNFSINVMEYKYDIKIVGDELIILM